MIDFEYIKAHDVSDAVSQIAQDPAARFIAGGTNLIDLMKENVERRGLMARRRSRAKRNMRPNSTYPVLLMVLSSQVPLRRDVSRGSIGAQRLQYRA
jgi:hypothetical protein